MCSVQREVCSVKCEVFGKEAAVCSLPSAVRCKVQVPGSCGGGSVLVKALQDPTATLMAAECDKAGRLTAYLLLNTLPSS